MFVHTARRAVNVKALIITLSVLVLLGVGVFGGHRLRKRAIAANALKLAQAAVAKSDWPAACTQFRLYVDKFPDDAAVLNQYGAALLMQPLTVDTVMMSISVYSRLCRMDPTDDAAFKRLVSLYTAVQNYDEIARAAYVRLDKRKNDPKLRIVLAQALYGKKDYEGARTILDDMIKTLESDPKSRTEFVEASRLRSLIAASNGTPRAMLEGRKWLDSAVAACPDIPEAYLYRAQFLYAGGIAATQPALARADLDHCSSLAPVDPRIRLALSVEWLELGEPARAKAELEAVADMTPDAVREYYIDPDEWKAARLKQMAEILIREPRLGDRVALAEQIERDITTSRHRLDVLPSVIRLYVAAQKSDPAQKLLDEYLDKIKGVEQTTKIKTTISLLSAMVAGLRNVPYRVIESLEPVVAANIGDPAMLKQVWKQLADSYNRTDQPARAIYAIENYLRLEQLHPSADPGEGIMQAAMLYMKQRRWSTAVDLLNRIAPAADEPVARLEPARLNLLLMKTEAEANDAIERPGDPARTLDSLSQRLKALHEAFPDQPQIASLQATILASQGHTDEAVAMLESVIKTGKDTLAIELQLGRLLRALRRFDEAVAVAQATCRTNPASAAAWLALADALRAAGKPADAQSTLENAEKSVSAPAENREIATALAIMEATSANPAPGIDRLKKLAEADRLPGGQIRADPASIRVRSVLLSFPTILADKPYAKKLCDEVRAVEGAGGLLWQMHQASIQLAGPDWRSRQNDVIELLKHCTDGDPRWPRPAVMLGKLYEELSQPDKAEAVYRRALSANPGALDVADQLLNLLNSQQRVAESKAVLDQLMASPQALGPRRASVAMAAKDLPQAIDELERQRGDNPKDVTSRVLLARAVYEKDKDFKAAARYLDEAERVAPDSMLVAATRADLLKQEGRDDDAIQALNAAVEKNKTFNAYYVRGAMLARMGRAALAEQDFQKLAELRADGVGYELLGKFYVDNNRIDDAIAALDRGAKACPQNESIHHELIKALLVRSRGDDRAQAEAILNRIESARKQAGRPDDPDLLWIRARILVVANTNESVNAAREKLETLLRIEPTHVEAYLALIDMAMTRQDFTEARELALRALGASPRDNRLRLARAQVERATGNVGLAREIASQLTKENPGFAKAYAILAGTAMASRDKTDLESSLSSLEKGIAASPENEELRLLQAAVYVSLERASDAMSRLQEYERTHMGRVGVEIAVAIADLYRTMNKFDDAEQALTRAAAIKADHPALRNGWVRLWSAQKKFDRIVACIKEYRDGNGDNPDVLYTAAILLAREGGQPYVKTAMDLLEYGVSRSPRAVPLMLSLGLLAYQSGDLDRAIATYRRALAVSPKNVQALNDLAWIYTDAKHDHKTAVQLADEGVKLDPDNSHLLDTRATALTGLGRHREALADFTRAVEVLRRAGEPDGDLARALLQVARCQSRLKRSDEAKRSADEALAIDRKSSVLNPQERSELESLRQPDGR